jgi:hypothetical protein
MSGSNTANAAGVYGTQGVAAANNVPGARRGAVSWTDSSGNLWLFGGLVSDSTGINYLNDLWEFSPTTKEWTWVSGSDTANAAGVYGTQGVASAGNVPGAREGAVGWIDEGGNLWLFGGEYPYYSNLAGSIETGDLNDLWEFSPLAKEWTWVSGSNTVSGNPGSAGCSYGTLGVPSANNVPCAQGGAVGWIDSGGNLWLYGGHTDGDSGDFNDLWEFNPTAKTWTWVSGPEGSNLPAIYGTQGVAAAGNSPGGRDGAVSWIDGSGNFWLFGGDDNNSNVYLNDLWEFGPTAKEWTWVSGNNTVSAVGVYGTQGVASASNVPGARGGAVSWTDSSGNLWLFGGLGFQNGRGGVYTNDLWEFSLTTKEWTWVSGSDTVNAAGVYGTLGTASTTDVPGAREGAIGWIDSSGNLWLFGGEVSDSTGISYLNDLWRYQP